jgi:hypothetical protein
MHLRFGLGLGAYKRRRLHLSGHFLIPYPLNATHQDVRHNKTRHITSHNDDVVNERMYYSSSMIPFMNMIGCDYQWD